MFSRRVPASFEPNRLSAAVARHRATGRHMFDLTVTNPTRAGLPYPDALLGALTAPRASRYEPEAFGLREAREAVAAHYAEQGALVDPEAVILTASTSEAYSLLFKLLCDPSEGVLVPVPSYPLFEHLALLEAVACQPYPLEYHGVWSAEMEALRHATTPASRALLVVAPNNPTGSLVRSSQLPLLEAHCAQHDLAMVVDEVFLDYPLEPAADAVVGVLARPADPRILRVVLGGLSKAVGLPQMKLAWMVVQGPTELVGQARARLELICDTYLSVGTPVQVGAAGLLRDGARVRDAIAARIRRNLATLRSAIQGCPACDVPRVEGGWSAVIRVPSIEPEETLVLDLLEREGVLVHPGFFFDFTAEAYLVISLLPTPDEFDEGLARVVRRVTEVVSAPRPGRSEGAHA
jgi:hypothetical protein